MNNRYYTKNAPSSSLDNINKCDEKWMERALMAAIDAATQGEVPIGAVLIKNDTLIATGGNSPIGLNDPTAHAEIVAIRNGATVLNNYRLLGTTLYVTLEPCVMCMGAILHARIDRLVYGAPDLKSGAVSSRYNIGNDGLLNHSIKITGSILENKCASLLTTFFAEKRKTLEHSKKEKI